MEWRLNTQFTDEEPEFKKGNWKNLDWKNRESQLIFPTTPAAFSSSPGWSYRPYLPPRGWRPVSQKPPQSDAASHRQEGNDIQLLSYNTGLLSLPGKASPTLSRRLLLGCSPQHQTTPPSLLLGFFQPRFGLFLGETHRAS